MMNEPEPNPDRLAAARERVQTFLIEKKRWTKGLFILTLLFEATFFVLMLAYMDFNNQNNCFIFFGFCWVYCPLITFTWRNAVKIDQLYYRLVNELKYNK